MTERFFQLKSLGINGLEIVQVLDYAVPDEDKLYSLTATFRIKITKTALSLIKRLFLSCRLLLTLNNEVEFRKLRPWSLSARGHYSYITPSEEELIYLLQILGISQEITSSRPKGIISVHYRLGDLMYLEQKTYVNPLQIEKIVQDLPRSYILHIYSDSSAEILKSTLPRNLFYRTTTLMNLDLRSTFLNCIDSEYFIGTNSKISLWIAYFKIYLNPKSRIFLPEGFSFLFTYQNAPKFNDCLSFY